MAETNYNLYLKGYVGGWDFDADYVDYIVAKQNGAEMKVLINSLGGSLQAALSVSAAFKRHGNVHVHYSGMNASAATLAGMGAKRITIDSNALWLVHNSSYFIDIWEQHNASGLKELAASFAKEASDLETFDNAMAAFYASRCKKSAEELAALMAEDKWLTAQEALEWGFVDEVEPAITENTVLPESVMMAMKEEGLPVPGQMNLKNSGIFAKINEIVLSTLNALGIKPQKHNMENTNTPTATVEPQETTAPVQEQDPAQEQNSVTENEDTAPDAEENAAMEALMAQLEEARKEIENLRNMLNGEAAETTTDVITNQTSIAPAAANGASAFSRNFADAVELFKALP